MKPNLSAKQSYEELLNKALTDDETTEMVATLTMFIEKLAEIDQQQKEMKKIKQEQIV